MSRATKWLIGLTLLAFVDLNLYALWTSGLEGLFTLLASDNAWAWVLAADVVIALTMVVTWLWRDARSRGVSPVPYALATAATGSVGPLVYLLRRPTA